MTIIDPFLQPAAEAVRLLLAVVFIVSGGAKLPDLNGFVDVALSYAVVPAWLRGPARYVAYILPFTEIAGGVMLLIGLYPLPVLAYIGGSLVFYIILQSGELALYGGKENCGCYGTLLPTELSWLHVTKNWVLLLGAVFLAAVTI